MPQTLRDRTTTQDSCLARIVTFDEGNRDLPIAAVVPEDVEEKLCRCILKLHVRSWPERDRGSQVAAAYRGGRPPTLDGGGDVRSPRPGSTTMELRALGGTGLQVSGFFL